MTQGIVSREAELASLRSFIESAEGGPSALVLEGEAGIGKSTLWLAGIEHASDYGLRVLSSRPTQAEHGLDHAGISDLFESVLAEVLPTLAAPRRHALEVALLLDEAQDASIDHRALAVAVRDGLQTLSEGAPLVLAVDDVQWLDPASSSALIFALRRLDGEKVRVLLSWRLEPVTEPPAPKSALEPERVRLGPLTIGPLHQLLRDRLGRTFARQTLLRIHERSGGNPFYALEVARILETDVDPLEPLPIPETLDGLVRVRLAGLPEQTREALELASALGSPSEALLERAGVEKGALDPALAANVVERESGMIRFTHPLLSSALYNDLGEGRWDVHRRIAEVADDPVARARHLALSCDEPDAEIAKTLDAAATTAGERGDLVLAAELAEQALRLTVEDSRAERSRRALDAARAHQAAGEWTRAQAIATELLSETESELSRAEALIVLSELESVERS